MLSFKSSQPFSDAEQYGYIYGIPQLSNEHKCTNVSIIPTQNPNKPNSDDYIKIRYFDSLIPFTIA